MRAFIDLQWMEPGYTGGIEFQARSFLNTLCEIDSGNQYNLLLPYSARGAFDFQRHPNFHAYFFGGPAYYASRVLDETARRFKLSRQMTRERIICQATQGVDVGLSISGYTAPNLRFLPTVLSVPDIQHEFLPELFDPGELARRTENYRASIQSARHLCAISNFTRQTLIERLQVPKEKITVTHLAPDPIFQRLANIKVVREICSLYQVPFGEYLYFPAATWPHKNHRSAILALHQFNQTYHKKVVLVCSGPQKEAYPEIQRLIEQLDMLDQVRFLGFVPRNHLPALYAGAAALFFPSLFEGFGMPVLEAMACGCPVTCSNTTSLPEIAGDAAALFDPDAIESIVSGIETVLLNHEIRETLIHKGYEQASRFSWIEYTRQTLEVMQIVGNQTGFFDSPILPQ